MNVAEVTKYNDIIVEREEHTIRCPFKADLMDLTTWKNDTKIRYVLRHLIQPFKNKMDEKLDLKHISDNVVCCIMNMDKEEFDTGKVKAFDNEWKYESLCWLNKFKSQSISIMKKMAETAYLRAANSIGFRELLHNKKIKFRTYQELRKETIYINSDLVSYFLLMFISDLVTYFLFMFIIYFLYITYMFNEIN